MNEREYQLSKLAKVGDKPFRGFQSQFLDFANSLPVWLRAAYYADGFTPRARNDDPKSRGKTRRGAIHQINPTFKSTNILGISPAEYRRRHLGAHQV